MNTGTRLTKSGALAHLRTLDDVVDDYLERFQFKHSVERSEGHHDPVVDYTREAPDITTAIQRACAGRRRDGKMWVGGSCVRNDAKQELTRILLYHVLYVKGIDDFDVLYDFIERCAPPGIGPYTVYNVTARLAARRGLEPRNNLYLHAGPLQGWRRLTNDRGSRSRVPLSEVPVPLRRLPLHKIEDLLCEYRELLNPEMMR